MGLSVFFLQFNSSWSRPGLRSDRENIESISAANVLKIVNTYAVRPQAVKIDWYCLLSSMVLCLSDRGCTIVSVGTYSGRCRQIVWSLSLVCAARNKRDELRQMIRKSDVKQNTICSRSKSVCENPVMWSDQWWTKMMNSDNEPRWWTC